MKHKKCIFKQYIIKKYFGLYIDKYEEDIHLLPVIHLIIHNHYYSSFDKRYHFHFIFEFINFYFDIRIGRDE